MPRLRLPDPALTPRFVAIDLRRDAIAWAESAWRPGGVRLVACGEEPCRDGERPAETLERLARRLTLSRARICTAIRHPDLRLQRIELPVLADRDARRVAGRRGVELAQELGVPGGASYALARGRRARPAWLAAVPEEFASFAEGQWESLGLPVAHFESLHLALGSLSRLLAPPADGELRAFFDIGEAHATCVVADGEGWVFSRDIPLKMMAEGGGGEAADATERIATELRRTLHYVESELRLGRVSELIVSGARGGLEDTLEPLARETGRDVRLLGDEVPDGPAAGASPALGIALGIAMGCELALGGSLLSAPAARSRRSRRLTGRLALATIFLAALAVAGVTFVGGSLHTLADAALELDRTWLLSAPLRDKTSARIAANRRADELRSALPAFERPQPPWPGALDSIGALLPDDAVLQRMDARRATDGAWLASLEVEFRGADMAEAAANVSEFAAQLGESPLWRIDALERTVVPTPAASDGAARVHFRVDASLAATGGPAGVALDQREASDG